MTTSPATMMSARSACRPATLRRARSDLSTQVRNAYFAVLVAREAMRVNRALARLTDEVYRIQVDLTLESGHSLKKTVAGRPLVRFSDIPLEWSDFRLTFRQTADILHRYEALERADFEAIVTLSRNGNALEPIVTGAADHGVDAHRLRPARSLAAGERKAHCAEA